MKQIATDAIEIARAEAQKATLKLHEMEEAERDKVARPALRKSLGKCFVYQNSYGDGNKWPLYCRIVAFDEKAMSYTTVQFQRTSRDIVEVHERVAHNWRGISEFGYESGWEEIPLAVYNRARKSIVARLGKLLDSRIR